MNPGRPQNPPAPNQPPPAFPNSKKCYDKAAITIQKVDRRSPCAAAVHLYIPTRKSLMLQSVPAADLPLPRIRRAPSFLLSVNLSRAPANASFTNALLPITAPSVKYLTRHLSIFAIPRSGRTVSSPSEASISAVFFVTASSLFLVSCVSKSCVFPGFLPSASPIARR